jgi:threonine dehydrogenase-like Zn-dependent dehydrogenase
MQRAVWGKDNFTVEEYDPGPLEAGRVRISVSACGICGSDLHTWHADRRPVGLAPGHEFVGTILDGPAGLDDVLYAVRPNISCGACKYCRTGKYNLCAKGGPGFGLAAHGGLAQTVDAPVENLAPVGATDPVIGSMTGPPR